MSKTVQFKTPLVSFALTVSRRVALRPAGQLVHTPEATGFILCLTIGKVFRMIGANRHAVTVTRLGAR